MNNRLEELLSKHYTDEEYCLKVLNEFGLDGRYSRIINGHIPVKVRKGEGPVKANGRLVVIDGGFCRAYQSVTGIAGYTMFFSSRGIRIAAHQPWEGLDKAINDDKDIASDTVKREDYDHRIPVAETDTGTMLKENIDELQALLQAYRNGILPQVYKK